MQYRQLGDTDIEVSLICLGSMLWGSRNTEVEGHEQMDYAFGLGVNFIDTAEMYAVPPTAKTYGRSEEVIGTWMKARGNRDKVILATKVAGHDDRLDYIRDGHPRLNRWHIEQAINASLARLQTDYVDLYQLHWPDREMNKFGQLGYLHDHEDDSVPIEETLEVLGDLVKAGKVRTIGLSNESPWGMMKFVQLAERMGFPRVVSVQNPYSLLNRSFEAGCAEVAIREKVGLLAYAPMAAGALSGKYLGGARPEGARMTLNPGNTRYLAPPNAEAATQAYVDLARARGIDSGLIALAWVNMQHFLTSNIIGATTMDQLRHDMTSVDVTLDEATLEELEKIHARYTYPCP